MLDLAPVGLLPLAKNAMHSPSSRLVVAVCSSVSTVMASNPGPSGLCIQASMAVTLQAAGNGDSTNGSSDTPTAQESDRDTRKVRKYRCKGEKGQG